MNLDQYRMLSREKVSRGLLALVMFAYLSEADFGSLIVGGIAASLFYNQFDHAKFVKMQDENKDLRKQNEELSKKEEEMKAKEIKWKSDYEDLQKKSKSTEKELRLRLNQIQSDNDNLQKQNESSKQKMKEMESENQKLRIGQMSRISSSS